MDDFWGGALSGGVVVALVAGVIQTWLSERLKQSISHEYSTKLEALRSELGAKLEAVKHGHEVDQLRTSLFFDHQRTAFGEILAKVVEVQKEWDKLVDPQEGPLEHVPTAQWRELEALYFKHQLFLDSDLLMALELLFEFYTDSLPYFDGSDLHERDVIIPFGNAEFLKPRLASLFRMKIGVGKEPQALREIALFGAIRLLNRYHFPEIGLPASGALKVEKDDLALKAIARADENIDELIETLDRLLVYIPANGFFYEAEASARRYLAILQR